jgi:hypothetical protein
MFGSPLRVKLPSYLYLALALGMVLVVVLGEQAPTGSWLFQVVVLEDGARTMSIRTFAAALTIGAVAAVLRASMRGVRVHVDGVESREVHGLIVPRVRRYKWLELECIVLDQKHHIALDLWDGSRTFLPAVRDRSALSALLEQVAAAHSIRVRGGVGLDEIVAQDAES